MKKRTVCVTLFSLFLVMSSPLVLTKESSTLNLVQMDKSEVNYKKNYKPAKGKQQKTIDGTTSASKLRAKKSHSVSQQDETKLTVFLGLFAIAIIVFFVRFMGDNK